MALQDYLKVHPGFLLRLVPNELDIKCSLWYISFCRPVLPKLIRVGERSFLNWEIGRKRNFCHYWKNDKKNPRHLFEDPPLHILAPSQKNHEKINSSRKNRLKYGISKYGGASN